MEVFKEGELFKDKGNRGNMNWGWNSHQPS